MRNPCRFLLTGLLAVVALVAVPGATERAEAASCSAMRSELASLQKGGNSSTNAAQIARLEQRARANGCRGSSTFGRPRVCAGIDAQIRNLRAGGGSGNRRRIATLQRRIAQQCQPTRRASRSDQPRQAAVSRDRAREDQGGFGGFLARLFGGGAPIEPAPARRDPNVERVDPSGQPRSAPSDGDGTGGRRVLRGGGLTTYCVRLCDGYYFPIARRTSSSNYEEQYALCRARCPGADVSLYSTRTDSPPERMRSAITGEAYAALPTAFAYRRAFYPDCSCQPKEPMTRIAEADTAGMVLAGIETATDGSRVRATLRPVGPVAIVGGRATVTSAALRERAGSEAPGWLGRVEATTRPLLPPDELEGAEGEAGERSKEADADSRNADPGGETVGGPETGGGAGPDGAGEDAAAADPAESTIEAVPAPAVESEAERAATYAAASAGTAHRPGAERLPQGELPARAARPRLELLPRPRDDELPANAGGPAMATEAAPEPTAPAEPLRLRTVGPTFFAVRVAEAEPPSPDPTDGPSELP